MLLDQIGRSNIVAADEVAHGSARGAGEVRGDEPVDGGGHGLGRDGGGGRDDGPTGDFVLAGAHRLALPDDDGSPSTLLAVTPGAQRRISLSDTVSDRRCHVAEGTDRNTVLGKAVAILRAFAADDATVPLAELARRTGLHKATVHRLAGELVGNRLLDRVDGGNWLSGGLFELGMLASVERSLLELAMPFLQDLYECTHQTVHLGVWESAEVVYVAKIGGHRQAALPSRTGGRMPLHCTALGKVLLAHADPELRRRVLSGPPGAAHPADGRRRRTPRPAARRGARDRGRLRARGVRRRHHVRRGSGAGRRHRGRGRRERDRADHAAAARAARPGRPGGSHRAGEHRRAAAAALPGSAPVRGSRQEPGGASVP